MGRRSWAQTGSPGQQTGGGHDAAWARGDDPRTPFPLVVAGLSTLAALALFFSATAPAMQEEKYLDRVEAEQRKLHHDLWSDLDTDASVRAGLEIDVQSLMVELDRRGVYTGDLVSPAPPPASPLTITPRSARGERPVDSPSTGRVPR